MWLLNQINLFTVNNCIAYGGWVPTRTGNQPVAGNPDKPAMGPHTLGVTAPVTLNDSGEWIDASENKNQTTNKQTNKQRTRLGPQRGHTMRWRSQRKGGGTTITTKSQLSLEGAMRITLNNTSTRPTGAALA